MINAIRFIIILSVLAILVGCNDEPSNPTTKPNAQTTASNAPPPPPPSDTSSTPNATTASSNPTAPAAPDANLPNWESDKSVLDQLGDYVDFEGYQIRIPKGYKASPSPPAPPGMKIFAWAGDPREDGSRPMVMVMILTPPPEAGDYSVQDALESMLKSVKNRRANWQQSPLETGLVNGVGFLKTSWQGQDTQTQLNMHGIEYIAHDSSSFIAFRTQDFESHLETLKTGEASILTFRKKKVIYLVPAFSARERILILP